MATCNTSEVYDRLEAIQDLAEDAGRDAQFQIVTLENTIRQGILDNRADIPSPSLNYNSTGSNIPEVGLSTPDRPDDDNIDSLDISGAPSLTLDTVTISDIESAPEYDIEPFIPQYSTKPSPFTGTAPSEPTINEVNIPDPFTYTLPSPPADITVPIPTITTVNFADLISDIEALYTQRPTITNADINNHLSGIENLANDSSATTDSATAMMDLFENRMLNNSLFQTEDSMIDVMNEIVNGTRDVGLPASVEDQMYARARSRVDADILMSQQEAMTDMSARGFTLPNGILTDRLDYATQQGMLKKKDLNRDLVITHYQEKLKEFWNAAQTVSSLSNQRFGLYVNLIDLGLKEVEVRGNLLQVAVTARASLIQSQVAAFNSAASIFNTRVQVELSQLEKDKLALEAAQLQNNVRLADIQVYVEKVKALSIEAEVYKTQMESARLSLEAEGLKIENFMGLVNAYKESVNAKKLEFDSYASEIQAEVSKIQGYQQQVAAYSERVSAWATMANDVRKKDELRLKKQEVDAGVFATKIQSYQAILNARVQAISSQVQKFQAQTGLYGQDVQLEVSRATSELERAGRVIQLLNLDLTAATANKGTYNDAQRQRWQAGVEAQKLILESYNNLQAAALSSLDVAASVSSACNESITVSV